MNSMSTYIGGAVLKSKLLDEAVNFALSAGNLGTIKIIKVANLALKEDRIDTEYKLQVEGLTYPIEGTYSKILDSISKTWVPSVAGSYTIPVINLLPNDSEMRSIGKCVFCDLIALQKITRIAKTYTTISIRMDTKSININSGNDFSYSLGTVREIWEKNAIILRQIEKMYK